MPERPRLTARQRQILEWIAERTVPPTYREIGAAFGFLSPNGVACHIRNLQKKGYLTIERGKSRGLRVVGANDELLDLLKDAREFVLAAVRENVTIPDFDPAEHNLNRQGAKSAK